MRSLPRRTTFALGLVLVTLVASACVKENKPGLAIRNLQSNIVFGINPPAAPLGSTDVGGDSFGFDTAFPEAKVLPDLQRPVQDFLCDVAGINAASTAATLGVKTLPKLGLYRWRQGGYTVIGGVKVPIPALFLNRQIVRVSPVTEERFPLGGPAPTEELITKTFTYDVRSDLSNQGVAAGYRIDTFQVKDQPLVVNLNNGIPVAGGGLGKAIIVGDPERGITLQKSVTYAPNGTVRGSYDPVPGLLMMPLSVNSGEEFQSVGVDPANGAVTVLDGKVVNRQTVDACGTLVDGWAVTARQYFAGADFNDPTLTRVQVAQYDYRFATQLGGILTYEKVGPPDINNVPIPTVPIIPGLPPIPGAPPITPAIPPLPVPLPTIRDTVELTLAQRDPSPLLNP